MCLCLSQQETSCDLLERLCDRFNILPSSAERLAFYEREISLSLQVEQEKK